MKARTAWAVIAATCCGLVSSISRGEGQGPRVYQRFQPRIAATQALRGCPGSVPAWLEWRDGAIATLLQPRVALEGKAGLFIDPDQVAAQSFAIANVLDDCAESFTDAPRYLGNLQAFTLAQRNSLNVYHQFAHGPVVDDIQYLARIKHIADLPCLLRSPMFLRKISDVATYKDAALMIDRQNSGHKTAGCKADGTQWDILFYKSAFLGTPDASNTFGRLLVRVPGDPKAPENAFDKWIQFGIWTPDDTVTTEPINNISVVAVPSKQNSRGDRFTAMVDWWRVFASGSTIRLSTRKEVTGITGDCQQCHKAAPIGIHPEWTYEFKGSSRNLVRAENQTTVANSLNKYILDHYTQPTQSTGDGDSYAEPSSYGPALAPPMDRMTVKPEFMRACTARHQLDEAAIKHVSDNMTCSACHNGGPDGHGILNFPMATQRTRATQLSIDTWPNLIYAYIKKGLMPPPPVANGQLTDPEREALFDCLTLEYFDPELGTGLLVDWFKSESSSLAWRPVLKDEKSVADLEKAMRRPKTPSPSIARQFPPSKPPAAPGARSPQQP